MLFVVGAAGAVIFITVVIVVNVADATVILLEVIVSNMAVIRQWYHTTIVDISAAEAANARTNTYSGAES